MPKLEEVLDKIGILSWLIGWEMAAYPIFDHVRIRPKLEKMLDKMEEFIREYKKLKLKQVV